MQNCGLKTWEKKMNVLLIPLLQLISTVIGLYMWAVIIMVLLTLLFSFGIINHKNAFVVGLNEFLFRITEPVLSRIRNMLPNFGAFDISPVILILLLAFVNNLIGQLMIRMMLTGGIIH